MITSLERGVEETHNTREGVKQFIGTWLPNGREADQSLMEFELRELLHQELQKARENTLKKVVGIIKSVQVNAQKMSADDTRPEKAKMINDWLMPEVKRNIIEALQSELDQPEEDTGCTCDGYDTCYKHSEELDQPTGHVCSPHNGYCQSGHTKGARGKAGTHQHYQ